MIRSLTDVEHVLSRPGMYTGCDVGMRSVSEWQFKDGMCEWEEWTCNTIVRKCIDEILSNAIDNTIGNAASSIIDVQVESNTITIMNDGFKLLVDDLSECGANAILQAFGQLRSSSHYDNKDSTAGTFGIGCKVANIYSSSFRVEVVDTNASEAGYEWTDHMTTYRSIPVNDIHMSAGSIRITFEPDAAVTGEYGDLLQYMPYIQHRCLEASIYSTVEFTVGQCAMQETSPEEFIQMHMDDAVEVVHIGTHLYGCLLASPLLEKATVISMVNGHRTLSHGVHVDDAMTRIQARMRSRKCPHALASRVIHEHMFLLVSCNVVNPTFSSQAKERLIGGSIQELKLFNTKDVDRLLDDIHARIEMVTIMKIPKQVRRCSLKIEKLQDAVLAGTNKSELCTLILTEGDSAKTFAMSGLGVIGHDCYGVFPLRGKALNARDETDEKIMTNAEWRSVMDILGLHLHSQTTSSMRYGHVMILADADLDGTHIAGLIINFFDARFPSLLREKPSFLQLFRTPVVKTRHQGVVREFFSMHEFCDAALPVGATVHYYKGLGSSTREEAKAYFVRRAELTRTCSIETDEDRAMLKTMFSKSMSGARKALIRQHIESPMSPTDASVVSASAFVRGELLWFAAYAVARSIPNIMDGMKTSQRKVLHVARGLKCTKVSQLASTVALRTCYLHGEQSLSDCIITLAQSFVGSNNKPLLKGIGQFGSRLQGGKDAASARYVHVECSEFMRSVIMKQDDGILRHLEEEGTVVEPEFFLPLLPLVLINGARGIATGFSTFVPCHAVRDVLRAVRNELSGVHTESLPIAYSGFRGTIEQGDGTCVTRGVIKSQGPERKSVTLVIEELPVHMWTETFLTKLEARKDVQKVTSRCDDVTVCIEVRASATALPDIQRMVVSHLSTCNMFLFDENHVLQRYESSLDIVRHFVSVRLVYYEKRLRREHQVLLQQLDDLTAVESFIDAILREGVHIFAQDPVAFLDVRSLPASLLKMPVSDISQGKLVRVREAIAKCRSALEENKAASARDIYMKDLSSLDRFC